MQLTQKRNNSIRMPQIFKRLLHLFKKDTDNVAKVILSQLISKFVNSDPIYNGHILWIARKYPIKLFIKSEYLKSMATLTAH